MTMATSAPRRQAHFDDATRQYLIQLNSIAYSASSPQTLRLPRVGFLARLYLKVAATIDIVTIGPGAYSERAPWTLLRRIRLIANNGFEIISTSGWGAYLKALVSRYASPLDVGLIASLGAVTTDFYNKPTLANGDNLLKFTLPIDVALNERDPLGLVLLQNDESEFSLELSWDGSPPSDTIGTAPTTYDTVPIVGTCEVHCEYFSVPQDPRSWPPINMAHQTLEDTTTIGQTGENVYSVPRGNTYVRIIHEVQINAVLSDAIDSWRLRVNQSDIVYNMTEEFVKFLHRRRYGIDLPKGVYVPWDFYMSSGIVNLGTTRDLVHSQDLSALDSIYNVTSGTTLGAGTNILRTVREQIVPLAA